MEERWVLYDCNSFYASVELLAHPELRQKMRGSVRRPREPAWDHPGKKRARKKLGVKTAETIWQAKRKCPDLVLLPPTGSCTANITGSSTRSTSAIPTGWSPFSIDEAGWT